MRTVKIISEEVEKAWQKYQNHGSNCSICQAPVTCAEYEYTCPIAEDLYEDYNILILEKNQAEFVFQQEIKDRANQ